MPQGVDCENSHLFSLRTAMGVARLHAVCQIEMGNVKQDALHESNLARTWSEVKAWSKIGGRLVW